MFRAITCFVLLACAANAQWLRHPTPGIPRTPDGQPDLTAPVPRAPDGHPDLSGIWLRVRPPGAPGGPDFGNTVTYYMKDGETPPLKPWAADLLYQRRWVDLGGGRPSEHCLPHGVIGGMLPTVPFKLVQHPGLMLMLYEQLNHYRQVFTDGRDFPEDMQPSWYGYSIGYWENDTFVIDTKGFNDRTWLDDSGYPHSGAMRTYERFHRIDFGHMDLEIVVDDPEAYTAPWSVYIKLELMPDTELIEDVCDNEKDAAHFPANAAK